MSGEHRSRIYERYVSSRAGTAPDADGLDYGLRAPYLERLLREHFPADRDARIVDLGCGDGALLHFASAAGYRFVRGIDRSGEQVALARRRGLDVEEGDLLELAARLADQSQDVVIAFDVAEHLTRAELLTLVDHIRRMLRPGGRCILHVPNAESPLFGRIRYGDFTHEQAFTRGSLHQILSASGFSEIACFEDTPVVHGAKSALRWALWKLIRSGLRFYLAVETGSTDPGAVFTQNVLVVAK